MIYNTRNRSNDTTESQRKKRRPVLMLFSVQLVENLETKTTYNLSLLLCLVLDTLLLCFVEQQAWICS